MKHMCIFPKNMFFMLVNIITLFPINYSALKTTFYFSLENKKTLAIEFTKSLDFSNEVILVG